MARSFISGRKPRSTTKEAKKIIRSEITSYYSPKRKGGGRSSLDNMKKDAEAYDGGYISRYSKSNYIKGSALVDAGCFACYPIDQQKMLGKIYGKKNVESWNSEKVHSTYKHLIGREYDSMLTEKSNKRK